MNVLAPILMPGVEPGVHYLDDARTTEALQHAVVTPGFRIFVLEGGAEIDDKDGFLEAAANAMGFPDYFGHNWDAFEECIRDLSWVSATGYVLFFGRSDRFAHADPSAWETALGIFRSAAHHWQRKGVPFYVFLNPPPADAEDGPTLRHPELADPAAPSPNPRGAT